MLNNKRASRDSSLIKIESLGFPPLPRLFFCDRFRSQTVTRRKTQRTLYDGQLTIGHQDARRKTIVNMLKAWR
jgi:hypothetical protein